MDQTYPKGIEMALNNNVTARLAQKHQVKPERVTLKDGVRALRLHTGNSKASSHDRAGWAAALGASPLRKP